MSVTQFKNNSAGPRTIAWSIDRGPRPSILRPEHHDPVQGRYENHIERHHLTVAPGQVGAIDTAILADLKANDPVVAAWFSLGDLIEVQA